MTRNTGKSREVTAVDDVRKVRSRLCREDGGDVFTHIEATRRAASKYHKLLGLKEVTLETIDKKK